jgi:catechol 2,3-dioxygenase-like lactoylglutathione lyase family enzyme
MLSQLRIARPVSSLEQSVAMYCRGLGLKELGRFVDHQGFNGVMVGSESLHYHFEFTSCRSHPIRPTPTVEDLLVFYVPQREEWENTCANLLAARFRETQPYNPYWSERGRTFADHDGYHVVIERSDWK